MGVIMQAFYWDCPRLENREYEWWNYIAGKIPMLKEAGFTALWIPPASKAANLLGQSMGYDPYDYYDLGDFEQKGSLNTWFGSKEGLLHLIQVAHDNELQVYADLVSTTAAVEMERKPIPWMTERDGPFLPPRAENFSATRNVSIPLPMKPGMTAPLATCRTFAIETPTFTPSCWSMPGGCWRTSGSTASGTIA
jgi:hypothetical protein